MRIISAFTSLTYNSIKEQIALQCQCFLSKTKTIATILLFVNQETRLDHSLLCEKSKLVATNAMRRRQVERKRNVFVREKERETKNVYLFFL